MKKFLLVIGIILLFLILVGLASAFTAFIFMLVWNYLAASVFDAPQLSFFQAWAIWFLFGLITSSFRVRHSQKD